MNDSDNHLVKVKREILEKIFNCHICKKLIDEATTISECMCTFCKQCIHDEIQDENLDSCPACKKSLGCHPLTKLRVDRNKDALRLKLFASHMYTSEETISDNSDKTGEHILPIIAPSRIKKKENSNNPLEPSSPILPKESMRTGTRSKLSTRTTRAHNKSCDYSVFFNDEDNNSIETSPNGKKPHKGGTSNHKARKTLAAESSKKQGNKKEARAKRPPLGFILALEAPNASRNNNNKGKAKANKEVTQANEDKPERRSYQRRRTARVWKPNAAPIVDLKKESSKQKQTNDDDQQNSRSQSNVVLDKTQGKKPLEIDLNEVPIDDEEDEETRRSSDDDTKTQAENQVRGQSSRSNKDIEINLNEDPIVDDEDVKRSGDTTELLFSLRAAKDRKGELLLPQISPHIFTLCDFNLTVLQVQQFLVRELNLYDENEVELRLWDNQVDSSFLVRDLIALWSSAEDVVMTFTYAPRTQSPFP